MPYAGTIDASLLNVATVSNDDEHDLIRRARDRDTHAFEKLYRIHVPRIYAVCLRMTADVRRAEEFTQAAFVSAWQKLGLFREGSAFSSWLHSIAVNAVLNDLRSSQRRTKRVFATDDLEAVETPRPPPDSGARLDLEQAVATLPRQARAIFVLHEVEGYSHDEIGTMMGIAEGTSKVQLHRARKLLQEALR
jgi:RNA polymerase sigma-70 factor, ECF subfamily